MNSAYDDKVYHDNENKSEHLNLGPIGIDYQNGVMEKITLKTSYVEWTPSKANIMLEEFTNTIYQGKDKLPEQWSFEQIQTLVIAGKKFLDKPFESTAEKVMTSVIETYIDKS